jgi:hypothetical protein
MVCPKAIDLTYYCVCGCNRAGSHRVATGPPTIDRSVWPGAPRTAAIARGAPLTQSAWQCRVAHGTGTLQCRCPVAIVSYSLCVKYNNPIYFEEGLCSAQMYERGTHIHTHTHHPKRGKNEGLLLFSVVGTQEGVTRRALISVLEGRVTAWTCFGVAVLASSAVMRI